MTSRDYVFVPIEPKTDNKYPLYGPIGMSSKRSMALRIPTVRWLGGITEGELPQTEEGLRKAARDFIGTYSLGLRREEAYVASCERYLALANLPKDHKFLKLLREMKKVSADITRKLAEEEALFGGRQDPLEHLKVETRYGRVIPYVFDRSSMLGGTA